MKKISIFSFFINKKAIILSTVIFCMLLSNTSLGQVTATEDFENETATNTFSESGINFNYSTFVLFNTGTYGYGNSKNFIKIAQAPTAYTTTGTIGLNTSMNPGIGFKINSFAGYVASDQGANTPYNGALTVSGIPVGGSSTISATINIASASGTLPGGQTRDGNGTVAGINFTGTALAGLYFTMLTFSINDADGPGSGLGTRFFEIDHINFTTSAPVTNQYAISNASYSEGNSGTTTYTYTVTRSINTMAGSVQIQSSNGTAIAGSDYVAVPLTTVNFTAGGPLTQSVNLGIIGNTVIEPNKTFNLTLSNPSGGTIATGTGVVTILDDDETTETFEDETANAQTFAQNGFTFASTGALMISYGQNVGTGTGLSKALDTRVGNGGSTGNVGSFSITNPGTSFYTTKIDVWTSNNDGATGTTGAVSVTFTGTKADGTGTVSYTAPIAAISGTNFQTVNFTGTPLDGIKLISISVILGTGINYISLDNFKYGTSSVAGTQISINDVSVLEGTGGGTNSISFTISRTNNTTAFSVDAASSDGTAIAGSDYTIFPSTTLNFTIGGALTQTVIVPILKDAIVESNETFYMNLSGVTNGTLYLKQVGIGTILDDDRITETFEDETANAVTFSENTVNFSSSGRLKVINSASYGSGSSNFYLSSIPNTSGGTVGKISITSAGKGFKLLQLDVLTSSGYPTLTAFVTGPVTFTGTLLDGTTLTTTKTITPTALAGTGFQHNISFTGTPLEDKLLTALEFSAGGSITTIDIDNFTYSVFNTTAAVEIADASNNVILNNGIASTTNNTDFGTACLPGSSIARTFTIKNTGAANLTFSGSPLAKISGVNGDQFAVTTQPAALVLPGASTTITITYTPTVVAAHNTLVTLTSNDANNLSFIINIKGAAASATNVTSQPVNMIMSGDGSNGLGTAIFSVSATNVSTYQWQVKSGNSYINLTNTAPYSGVSTNTLTISNPAGSLNNNIYNCLLTGTAACNTVSSNDGILSIISPGSTLPSGTLSGTDINTGTDAGWTFYAAGGNVGFAIFWNGNSAAKASAVTNTINGPANSVIRNPPGAIYAMPRYWNVTSTALSTPVKIRFYYTGIDKSGITTAAATYATNNSISNDGFKWFKTVGTPYIPANVSSNGKGISGDIILLTGTETVINGVYQTEFSAITSFSGGTGAASAGYPTIVLPVKLLFFTAKKTNDEKIDLSWSTASEYSSDYFFIERSTNGVDFVSIAKMASKGNSNNKQDYYFKDENPNIGTNFYRLSEVSIDGAITIFPIQTITMTGNQGIKIYPNPIEGQIFYVAADRVSTITIKTITGKFLQATFSKVSNSLYQVKLSAGLKTGVYLVTVKTIAGKETTTRLLIQ